MDDILRETLYSIIDHQNVLALNVVQQNNILKPWGDRNDETLVNLIVCRGLLVSDSGVMILAVH
jgi:hypothetical protein